MRLLRKYGSWLPAMAMLAVLNLQLSGCGQPSSSTVTPGNQTANASWNPPPVAATCTAGDANGDGVCDSTPVCGTNPDCNGNGVQNGMEMLPNGPGSGGGGGHLSPLAWALRAVAITALASAGYSLATNLFYDCQSTVLGVEHCISATWSEVTVRFDMTNHNMIVTVPVKVTTEHWLTFGFNFGSGDSGAIDYYFTVEPKEEPLATLSGIPYARINDPAPGDADYGIYMASLNGGGATPLVAGLESHIDADGCDGNMVKPGHSGAVIRMSGGYPVCLSWNFIQDYPTVFSGSTNQFMVARSSSKGTDFQYDAAKAVIRSTDGHPLAIPYDQVFIKHGNHEILGNNSYLNN